MRFVGLFAAAAAATVVWAAAPNPTSAQELGGFRLIDEARIGLSYHEDSRFKRLMNDDDKPTDGSPVDLNLDLRFETWGLDTGFSAADFILTPHPMLSASINLGDGTSSASVNLAWELDVSQLFFVEGALGLALHNGEHDVNGDGRRPMGCAGAFRQALTIGRDITDTVRLMATVEHLDNFELCDENAGLTNIGARIGYKF